MGYIKTLVDKMISMQDRMQPDLEEYRQEQSRVALLRIVGVDGETILLKAEGGKFKYASPEEKPVHIFRCSSDTFLDLLSGESTVRKEVTLGHFTIEDANSGQINLVELEKWSKMFERMKGLIQA